MFVAAHPQQINIYSNIEYTVCFIIFQPSRKLSKLHSLAASWHLTRLATALPFSSFALSRGTVQAKLRVHAVSEHMVYPTRANANGKNNDNARSY